MWKIGDKVFLKERSFSGLFSTYSMFGTSGDVSLPLHLWGREWRVAGLSQFRDVYKVVPLDPEVAYIFPFSSMALVHGDYIYRSGETIKEMLETKEGWES